MDKHTTGTHKLEPLLWELTGNDDDLAGGGAISAATVAIASLATFGLDSVPRSS